jgi:hypothetical protein
MQLSCMRGTRQSVFTGEAFIQRGRDRGGRKQAWALMQSPVQHERTLDQLLAKGTEVRVRNT